MSLRVLIADCLDETRQSLRGTLEGLGQFEFVEVDNGADAMARLTSSRFDLILLGVALPRLSGEKVLELIKSRMAIYPETPVLMICSDRASMTPEDAGAKWAYGCVTAEASSADLEPAVEVAARLASTDL